MRTPLLHFLALSAFLIDGLHVWPAVVRSRVMAELPFMSTEVILMQCVKAGGTLPIPLELIIYHSPGNIMSNTCLLHTSIVGDRQELHEAIRTHSMEASKVVKGEGENVAYGRIYCTKIAFICVGTTTIDSDPNSNLTLTGKPNDLLERISKDPMFTAVHGKLDQLLDPKLFVGRAPEQGKKLSFQCHNTLFNCSSQPFHSLMYSSMNYS